MNVHSSLSVVGEYGVFGKCLNQKNCIFENIRQEVYAKIGYCVHRKLCFPLLLQLAISRRQSAFVFTLKSAG